MDNDQFRALTPGDEAIRALPLTSNPKIAAQIFAVRAGRAIDIGCGEGKFTRALTAHFDEVLGADIKDKSPDILMRSFSRIPSTTCPIPQQLWPKPRAC